MEDTLQDSVLSIEDLTTLWCYSENSGNFPLGVKKAIEFPPGSTDIAVKVEEMWGFGWSTIFTKEYPNVVRKEFHLYGTTLHPNYREIEEGQSK